MYLRELCFPVEDLRGVGPETAALLAKRGISTAAGLLSRYPRDWEDRSRQVPLKDWNKGPVCTVVKVLAHDWFGYGPMRTLKIHIEDESARAVLLCFNRPFLAKQLGQGKSFRLWGRFFYKHGDLQSSSFEFEETGKTAGFNRIVPVYPLSAGLTQNLLRRLVKAALDKYGKDLENELPQGVIEKEGLLDKARALRALHFPGSIEELEGAKKTLICEELFYLEMIVGRRAMERRSPSARRTPVAAAGPPASGGNDTSHGSRVSNHEHLSPLQRQLLARLPFSLTAGQEEAIGAVNADMAGDYPMARLLEGDVGSGKTLAAFFAALYAVDLGGQCAIMAPTELLARQHAENAAKLLEPLGLRPAFLTGNLKAAGRARLLKALAEGEVDLVLGTHALFSSGVVYRSLRLVVIDEQHRFGVTQRQAILAKGASSLINPGTPDLLMMSATPIPRTLALTVFGDLDISVIRDMPPGRKPVKTHLARESNAEKVYGFVEKELAAGRQAYFVYPLIGDEETADKGLKNAVTMAERLSAEIFPRYKTALVHSRLEEEEKRRVMEAFRNGEINILAATSVVEVGVDVPNASCMVIHHAERFGLSALHQMRGRVGRGSDQAFCFLIYSEPEPESEPGDESGKSAGPRPAGLTNEGKERLKVMLENNDGFIIAEEDLKLRGPGQIAGLEQSGYLKLGIADPVRDAETLVRCRDYAFAVLKSDPALLLPEHRRIAEVLERAPPFTDAGL
ncbi:MAG: ATP-dependent DNA helicase RecG [Treponema sp.]|jgi:ATP-dependent DNA helicase RecG|nr:ATP-dependent DNA helicase RecG [Treponema sp.]